MKDGANTVLEEECPYCKCDEYEVIDSGLDFASGDQYFYTCECAKCGKQFTMWFKLELLEITKDNE